MRYSVVSLFSGGLGLDLGLAATGRFAHLACVEVDPAACGTIRVNRDAGRIDPGRLYEDDLVRLAPRRVMADLGLRPGQLDVLAGGPPCQPVSTAGKRGGVRDVRGLMLWQYLWYVEAMRPKCFALENVAGLLSARLEPREDKGTLLRRFLGDLPPEYRADAFLVDAADHGCPQFRKRVIVVGNRVGRAAAWPAPTHGPGRAPYRTLRDALTGLHDPAPVLLDFTAKRKRVLERVPPGGNWKGLPADVARAAMGRAFGNAAGGRTGWYRRLAWDRPCPTVVTSPHRPMTSLCHPDATRALTLRECAAVQQFPPGWEFEGTAAERFRAVGNAVPVGLGEVCGRVVSDLLDHSATCGMQADGGNSGRKIENRVCPPGVRPPDHDEKTSACLTDRWVPAGRDSTPTPST